MQTAIQIEKWLNKQNKKKNSSPKHWDDSSKTVFFFLFHFERFSWYTDVIQFGPLNV